MNPLYKDQLWMRQALHLALLAEGKTAPNPMVGAVLVYRERIIGRGWHHRAGTPHAEVHCIQSVAEEDQQWIAHSTMYVTLEPCSHFGRTPPCSDFIIAHKVPRVVIACRDTFSAVNGSGIRKLTEAGIEVVLDILKPEARWINRRFFTFHEQKRPYVMLKWAHTADGKMGSGTDRRLMISNAFSNRWVHRLRTSNQAVIIGSGTAMQDRPLLDNRLYPDGIAPVKVILDASGAVDPGIPLFQNGASSLIFTRNESLKGRFSDHPAVEVLYSGRGWSIEAVLKVLYEQRIQSVLVEGGKQVLEEWIRDGVWDEAWTIRSDTAFEDPGLAAPGLTRARLQDQFYIERDIISQFVHQENEYYLQDDYSTGGRDI
ncbi:MAG: bifunctional diaminohydroxyphosphoribosylaminopyrimidine deaminase/5-amino-6-(5-phosphoribosylamino)uracil reductase RibD [Taibaiella sp.]|nr:bifunctional diaminohydroxyphosphoribosylaminopyrimidine deaminase/5-amino-6-(5-phosphoribosylamino)uracil reductase RibD [Taibaiella sp.]